MKKLFSWLIALFFMSSTIMPLVFSATENAAIQLEIIAPTIARVGEAIDITVRAVDKDHKVVPSYRGSVIFNTDNIGDTIPAPGKTVTFTADDNGEKKFSKGLIFKKSGKQKISVYDVSDEIQGEMIITVEAGGAPVATGDQSITIITPENATKITGDMITVSGKTRKNSKVVIKLNGQDIGTVSSDEGGIYTKSIMGITQESNILTAELVDGSNTVIATSPEVKFDHIAPTVSTYGVMITPGSTVEASSPIQITIEATPGLSELSISLDGTILNAKEGSSGKYTIDTIAPQKPGLYTLPITQKDALGQVKINNSPTSLTVLEKTVITPKFKNIKAVTKGSKVVFDFEIENAPNNLTSFKIAYGKNADNLSQEVSTLPLSRIASTTNTGGYSWYIDKLPADTYTFKIFGLTSEGVLISGFVSEPIVTTIGKDSCTIGNVGGLTVKTDSSKSTISWMSLTGAVSYNLYKVSPSGDYVLFQNTTIPSYTLFLSKGAVVYENFVVKALCDTSTESKEYSSMSRVQSGPNMIAIIVIISAIIGAFLMRRRYI